MQRRSIPASAAAVTLTALLAGNQKPHEKLISLPQQRLRSGAQRGDQQRSTSSSVHTVIYILKMLKTTHLTESKNSVFLAITCRQEGRRKKGPGRDNRALEAQATVRVGR